MRLLPRPAHLTGRQVRWAATIAMIALVVALSLAATRGHPHNDLRTVGGHRLAPTSGAIPTLSPRP